MVEKRPLSPFLMVVNYHPYTWNSSIIPCKKIMKKSKVQNRLGLICYNETFGRTQYIHDFRTMVNKYYKSNLVIWIVRNVD